MSAVVEALRGQAGIAELEAAETAGVLDIDALGIEPVPFLREAVGRAAGRPVSGDTDKVVAAMIRGSLMPLLLSDLPVA